MDDREQRLQRDGLFQIGMRSADGCEEVLLRMSHFLGGSKIATISPTCSLPLKTYSLHPIIGFRASGGSLYFRTVLSPLTALTVFVSAARSPDGL